MKSEVVVSTKAQVDKFSKNFESELLFFSHLSSGTILIGACLLDGEAACHIIES
jgi:hypothetical protein